MRNRILISFLFILTMASADAQQPDKTKIRIVDTLTRQERTNRNPVILKAELDSMIQLHNASLPPVQLKDSPPVKEIVTEIPAWVMIVGIVAALVIAILLSLLMDYQKRLGKTVTDLKRLIQNFNFYTANSNGTSTPERNFRGKAGFEKKISELTTELEKEKAMNDELIEEYDLVKQSIAEVYKIRNYPLFDKNKTEQEIILDILKTEKTVASHAFEKYMKPLFAIADSNKNNPAKLSPEDSEKMLELLVSMSLYYIEYLYLRVNDLAVGGTMVQRIGSNGKGIDPSLLKKLNIEHGSRALALRMALNKSGISKLSYPVFDETDLNNF